MKKGLVLLVILAFLPIETMALPSVNLYPDKVYPGQVMLITLQTHTLVPIREAFAEIHHENGFDRLRLYLMKPGIFNSVYQGTWVAHDTLNGKQYSVDITFGTWLGTELIATAAFVDPAQFHPASQIESGTFGNGNFTFPNSIIVSKRMGLGTSLPSQMLEIKGNMNVDGSIIDRNGNTLFNGSTGKLEAFALPY